MSTALIIIGMLGFLICIIGLIVLAIRKKPKKPTLVALLICVVLFMIGVSIPDTSSEATQNAASSNAISASSESSVISSSVSSESDTMEIDYKTLYKDYDANPINADKKYRDKKLILTGTIVDIDRDIGQNPYITFNVDEYGMEQIKMSFDDDDTVAELEKGQTVTVKGTCSGTFTSTLIVLNDCEIMTK